MDRTGEQLRYSNRIVNSVALKSDARIGFCEMYQSNNGCLCMSVNRKNSEFSSFSECNGMCTKQNINIYIENFDAKRNNGKYDLKCKSVDESDYSFYKTVEQNSSNNKAFYADVAWLETNDKKHYVKHNSSLNYYPYNRQYLPESMPYVRKQIQNKSVNTTHFNLPQEVENMANNDNRTYMLQEVIEEDKAIINRLHDKNMPHIVSGNIPSSSCSNLYVAPPYFTVDKFVNEEKPSIRSISPNAQFYNENLFSYQKMPNNIEENSLKKSLVQNRPVHEEKNIGIKLVENPDISLSHFESSLQPVSLDITKRSRYLPIKKEKCNYENDFMLDSNFKTETNVRNISTGYDIVSSKSNPASQFNVTEGQTLGNKTPHELIGVHPVYNKVRNSEDLQFSYFRGNSKHDICSKNPNANIIIPASKNLLREVRKPNYRELINHVHALRNATSENDLNMQIIKRTLNYNQKPKEITTCNLAPRQFASNEVFINHKLNTLDPIYTKKPSNLIKQDNLFNSLTSNISPLDLSVKTVKSNADSTANDSCCKILISENGYPPKFNFKPNFSDNRCISNDPSIKAIESESYKFALTSDPSEVSQTKVVTETPRHNTGCCNQSQTNVNETGCGLKNETFIVASLPNPENNCVCNLQNCVPVEKDMNQDVSHSNGCKVVASLKRSAPFKSDLEKEYDKKKICVETFYHSETNSNKQIKELKITTDKVSSNINGNLPISNPISEPLYHIDNTKPQFEYKTATSVNESVQVNIEAKQDDSSMIAARIRTKAELKGFTFIEDKQDYSNETLSNKENYHHNDGSKPFTQVEDTVDLIDWKNACNNFLDQLIQSGIDSQQSSKQQKILEYKKQATEFKSSFAENERYNRPPENNFPIESNNSFGNAIDNSLAAATAIHSTVECNQYVGTNEIFKEKTDPKSEINHIKSDYSKSKYSIGYTINSYNTNVGKIGPKNGNRHINNRSPNQGSAELNKSCKAANTIISTDSENNKKHLQNNIDLKKISVVRLKREKYGSKRYTHYDKGSEIRKAKSNLVANCSNNTVKNASRKVKPTICEDGTSTYNQRQTRLVKSKGSIDLKSTAITTRLRHHMLQSKNKSELKNKSKNTQKSEANINKFRRHNIEKDHESSNDIDNLYLEVYRYKRALKIPPNLITIRNSSKQGISSSLPDLDIDIQSSSLQSGKSKNSDFKVEDVPKSIIDVLHSRVLKSKSQTKGNIRHTKNENQRSKIGQCNNRSVSLKQSNSTENNNYTNREYRNVFETQILASRTRTEYKMQLNKEVIREIFGGNERPASAPPETNNIKNDFQLVLEQHYNDFLNSSNNNFLCEIGGQQEQYSLCSQGNLREDKSVQKECGNKSDQIGMTVKCKKKKCGRSYRRKFSSGFDYLRKKKKSKARTLYKYTQLKSRVENYISEAAHYIKNEDDVSREIQKWVLNKSVGQSALHKAARLGYIDVIVYCLERMGLNPDHKDNAGYTPLHDACVNGSLEIARVLLQYGANHSEGAHSGIRPLHEASENGHIEVVRMLLSYGADPLLETYSGQTPLMLASEAKMSDFISKHLIDIQMNDTGRTAWRFPGPWKIIDNSESGYNSLSDIQSHTDDRICYKNRKFYEDAPYVQDNKNYFIGNVKKDAHPSKKSNSYLKNDICEIEILVDATDGDCELFEFEEANMPLPPLYMLKGEGMEKWVLLSDLCSLLKVKSKDTLLHKIFPSISPTTVSRTFVRELKMCDFLEKATCLQLLCAGEKINICHSKVVLVQYNENVRKLLGVKTILMKF